MGFASSCFDLAAKRIQDAEQKMLAAQLEYIQLVKTASWRNLWNFFAKNRNRDRYYKARDESAQARSEFESLWR